MVLEVLEIISPVLALAFVGFAWAKLDQPYDTRFISRLALHIAGPCLIFSTLAQVDLPTESFAAMALAALAIYALTAGAALTLLSIGGLPPRVYLPAMVFGNTGNVGLPICLFAYGQEGLALAMIVFTVSAVLMIAAASWIGSGEASPLRGLQEPTVLAALLGAAASLADVSPPDWIMRTLSLVGQMTIPMMLMTLGVSIARLSLARIDRAFLLAIGRIGVGAAAGLAVAELMDLEGAARGVAILQAMTPTAVMNYLFAERFGNDPSDVAGLVMISTALSIVAIPTTLALLL